MTMNKIFTLLVACMVLTGAAWAQNVTPTNTWKKRCSQNNYCEIYNRINVAQNGQARLAEFAIGFPKNTNRARGVVILPLGILVQPGVGLHIDDKNSYKFSINHCSEQGCVAYIDLNDDIINAMKMGGEARFVFFAANTQKLVIPMTLSGFTNAFNSIP